MTNLDNFARMNVARSRRRLHARLTDLLLGCAVGLLIGDVAGVV